MSNAPRDYSLVNPGDLHDVATNARRLGVLYSVTVELARLLGGWIPRTPELAEKLALGLMLFEDAEAAASLEKRLDELRLSGEEVGRLRRRTAGALKVLEATGDPSAFLSGLVRVVKPALVADLRRHIEAAPPYVDDPTVRILTRVIAEQERHIAKGLSLLADRGIGWTAYDDFERTVKAGLWQLRAENGGLDDGDHVGREPYAIERPTWPAAVTQLAYEDPGPPYPQDFDGAMRRCVHDLVFSELEALDVFAHYVYAFADTDFPWQFHHEAARIAWDEARHVELLLNVLERYDGTVGEFPAKAPGFEEYLQQDSVLEKIIMLNVIAEGEVSTDTQTQHRDAFRELGDELSATLKDYEMADEVIHGRFGLRWAHWLADRTGESYEAAHQRAYASLQEFKGQHDADGAPSPIPLVRLGVDETGDKRVMNLEAKKLIGFSDEEIAQLREQAGSVVDS
jgi:uncharacterized ferritin-like protein (DUF455 family)